MSTSRHAGARQREETEPCLNEGNRVGQLVPTYCRYPYVLYLCLITAVQQSRLCFGMRSARYGIRYMAYEHMVRSIVSRLRTNYLLQYGMCTSKFRTVRWFLCDALSCRNEVTITSLSSVYIIFFINFMLCDDCLALDAFTSFFNIHEVWLPPSPRSFMTRLQRIYLTKAKIGREKKGDGWT